MNKGAIIVIFDFPSVTNEEKKVYQNYIRTLKNEGFIKLQNSVWYKLIRNIKLVDFNINRIRVRESEDIDIKVIVMTKNQFLDIKNISGSELSFDEDPIILI